LMASRGAEIHSLVRRYGLIALALATLTPLPYSLACWASGALGVPFFRFCAVSLLRIPRIAIFLWLIQEGFVSLPTA
jgi:membrane protein YqaA with SNARE-associated domain